MLLYYGPSMTSQHMEIQHDGAKKKIGCNKGTVLIQQANCKKQCFICYQRYLSQNHNFRSEKDSFDGTIGKISPPKVSSCIEILNQVQDLEGLHLSKDPKIKKKKSYEIEWIIGIKNYLF